jgi:PAS domain S-box-containing protein
LRTTLQRFYLVLSSMYSGVLLVTNDDRVEFANPAFCERFGLTQTPAELVGLGAGAMLALIRDAYLRPEEAVARIRDILQGGVPVKGEELAMRGGRTYLRDYVPLYVEGRPYGRLWIHFDITERNRAEQALRENEERYRAFFDNLSEAVVVLEAVRDAGGAVVDWRCAASNAAHQRFFGMAHADIVGSLMSRAMDPAAMEALHRRNCRVLSTGEGATEEIVVRGRRLASTVFRLGPETVAVTALDVTERSRAEEALRETDRRRTDFLAVLSHELRNPLAPMRNSIYLLDRAAPGSAVALRAHQVLRRQTELLTRLVDDLLDVTRLAHGKIEVQLARLDAREVVRRACDDARSAFELRGVELEYAGPVEPTWVDADAARLAQMVGNLTSNALKFTPRGGQVRVSVRARDGVAEVSVRDTGAGLEPADLERIFDPFVQAGRTRAGAQGGLGLGLALVRDLAAKQGGSVRAASAGLGQGSEFVVSLPLAEAPAASPREVATGPAASGLSVLIVEDHQDAGASLADLLEQSGHEVRLVATGRAGIDAALQRPPDVLICDVGLPDLSGHEVIRAIRAALPAGGVFAVALTGYAQPEDRARAFEAGFDAHLAKPPALDALRALLAAAARGRR